MADYQDEKCIFPHFRKLSPYIQNMSCKSITHLCWDNGPGIDTGLLTSLLPGERSLPGPWTILIGSNSNGIGETNKDGARHRTNYITELPDSCSSANDHKRFAHIIQSFGIRIARKWQIYLWFMEQRNKRSQRIQMKNDSLVSGDRRIDERAERGSQGRILLQASGVAVLECMAWEKTWSLVLNTVTSEGTVDGGLMMWIARNIGITGVRYLERETSEILHRMQCLNRLHSQLLPTCIHRVDFVRQRESLSFVVFVSTSQSTSVSRLWGVLVNPTPPNYPLESPRSMTLFSNLPAFPESQNPSCLGAEERMRKTRSLIDGSRQKMAVI